jgi:hypothetical protein
MTIPPAGVWEIKSKLLCQFDRVSAPLRLMISDFACRRAAICYDAASAAALEKVARARAKIAE